ncbi:MAG TPA: hypothetical protein VG318_14860 [Actinomycetota bacterium]|nr:hypothetical protein [Actinomycetota bacterium]
MKLLLAAPALVLLLACSREPELVFVYEVGGRAGTVDVSYLGDKGLVEEEVTVPWTSEEMYTTPSRDLHIEVTGSPGDSLVCGLRWRLPEGRYGQDGSGALGQENDPEDAHRCELDGRAGTEG